MESGKDPDGAEDDSGLGRVVRGGGWNHAASNCRSAYRGSDVPWNRDYGIGFRLVRTLP